MRVSGCGNILEKLEDTIPGKLPQKVISKKATHGNSSYGNQIGLPTTHVREIIHPSYVAKHMEVGAVVGAAKAENVVRQSPEAGDVVILLGGKTGRDGIGGATEMCIRDRNKDNPCTKIGYCADCQLPTRICSAAVTLQRSHVPGRIHVLLINEDLGY